MTTTQSALAILSVIGAFVLFSVMAIRESNKNNPFDDEENLGV